MFDKRHGLLLFLNSLAGGLLSPLLTLLLLDKGLSLAAVPLAVGLYSATAVAFELPSGMAADRWGRKNCFLLSLALLLPGLGLFILGRGTAAVLAAMAFQGLSRAFSSGSLDALAVEEFLLQNGSDIGADIIDSMIKLSQSSELGISECADKTFKIAKLLIKNASTHGPIMEITIILEVVLIFVVLSLIIVKFAVMYVSAYFICVTGIFVLGFGALSFTRDLSINYLKMLFSIGLQLMCIILICNTGFSIFDDFINDLTNSRTVTFMDTAVLIFTSLFIYGLSTGTPQIVGQLIMGANISGDSLLKPVAVSSHIIMSTKSILSRSLSRSIKGKKKS